MDVTTRYIPPPIVSMTREEQSVCSVLISRSCPVRPTVIYLPKVIRRYIAGFENPISYFPKNSPAGLFRESKSISIPTPVPICILWAATWLLTGVPCWDCPSASFGSTRVERKQISLIQCQIWWALMDTLLVGQTIATCILVRILRAGAITLAHISILMDSPQLTMVPQTRNTIVWRGIEEMSHSSRPRREFDQSRARTQNEFEHRAVLAEWSDHLNEENIACPQTRSKPESKARQQAYSRRLQHQLLCPQTRMK
jgi:hypothetical protein